MIDNRFSESLAERSAPHPTPAFLVVPIAAQHESPLQWLYQKLYEQATQTTQQPQTHDLFSVMN